MDLVDIRPIEPSGLMHTTSGETLDVYFLPELVDPILCESGVGTHLQRKRVTTPDGGYIERVEVLDEAGLVQLIALEQRLERV